VRSGIGTGRPILFFHGAGGYESAGMMKFISGKNSLILFPVGILRGLDELMPAPGDCIRPCICRISGWLSGWVSFSLSHNPAPLLLILYTHGSI